jgi:hypothetical protein
MAHPHEANEMRLRRPPIPMTRRCDFRGFLWVSCAIQREDAIFLLSVEPFPKLSLCAFWERLRLVKASIVIIKRNDMKTGGEADIGI